MKTSPMKRKAEESFSRIPGIYVSTLAPFKEEFEP